MEKPKIVTFVVLLLAALATIAFANPANTSLNQYDNGIPPKAGTAPLPAPRPARTPATSVCASLTPLAIQQVVAAIDRSIRSAKVDVELNKGKEWGGEAQFNLDYLNEARTKVTTLQYWLKSNNLASPFVTNPSGAANVLGYMREAVTSLGIARYHAMVSGVYNNSVNARASYDLSTNAITAADAVGAAGGRCYMSSYIR